MNRKNVKGWVKHLDFIVLDLICLQVSYVLSFWMLKGVGNPYIYENYQYQAVILTVAQLLVVLFTNGYSGILRRRKFDELVSVIKHIRKK